MKKHTGPSRADRQLFKLWDVVEAERSQRTETPPDCSRGVVAHLLAPTRPMPPVRLPPGMMMMVLANMMPAPQSALGSESLPPRQPPHHWPP